MIHCLKKLFPFFCVLVAFILMTDGRIRQAYALDDPHGLEPADDMTFFPHLPGLRNKVFKNYLGQGKSLSEAVVLRGSEISDGKATVPAGGLFYLSETSGDAAPLRRDPFLLLGEHTYLVDLESSTYTVKDFSVKGGRKAQVEDTGYRMWYDYATDHYEKPYAELALISPSGGWPLEFPIASVFAEREEIRTIKIGEGYVEQLEKFCMDKEYLYGASRFVAKNITYDEAQFESIEFPWITEATFSMHRPIVMDVRQDDYRLYFDKRIYAFRRPDGFLVRVTGFTGGKVYAEKLIKPITAQGYKSMCKKKDDYHLTIPDLDIRIEIMVQPLHLKNSDFVPWSTGKSHGFQEGVLNFVVYRRLINVRHGEPWPLDKRYKVLLEPNMMTGMLQRLLIENAEPITFDKDHNTCTGPVKWSNFWNRPAFKVVVDKLDGNVVREQYLRDYFFARTENMVFWPKEGRHNIDFFIGSSPVLEPILEDTFLTRLADPSFGTVVEESQFTSYPKVISDSSFYEPDHTAPFVPRLDGLMRKYTRDRKKNRLISAESIFIRGSYVDYRNGKIIIPPAGLCYSSRNSRNMRTLSGEEFYMLGEKAYLASFRSSTIVRKNVHLDFWKNQPMGDGNLMYWQDELLGIRNKTLRMTDHCYLDDRPVGEMSLMKYSGNRWGAHFLIAQGLDRDTGNRYLMPEIFAEGATWIIPEYVGSNYLKIREFGTPSIESFSFTYKKPKETLMGAGEHAKIGAYDLQCASIDPDAKTVALVLIDETGKEVASKTLGPLDEGAIGLLPQYLPVAEKMQFTHEDIHVELDIYDPFKEGKARLYLYSQIQMLKRDTPFEFDDRFMVRPDVCGHCYQLNEVLLDNPAPIILDKDHPVYEGPKRKDGTPLFRIVIDHFDGEMIHAWHMETIEDDELHSTDNLAFRPRNNIDVLIGVTGTIEGFLRLSMLPRLGFMESWRISSHGPETKLSGSVNTGGSAHIRR